MHRLLSLIIVVFVSCGPAMDVRQGEVGEFCNFRDTDCRPGLVCSSGVCAAVRDTGFGCDAICTKLRICGTREATCESDCRITVSGWSDAATETFGTCLIDDLTCSEITADFAPQTCYERLALPEERQDTCEAYFDTVRGCSGDADTLRESCYRSARTLDGAGWDEISDCDEFVDTCEALANCVRNTTRD